MKYKKEWTLFLEGFRARTSALLARVRESTASNPGYSSSLPAYVAEFDRGTSSWRTRQRLLLGGSEQFSGNFPKWGMMRSGVVYQRQMSELHTAGTDGGVSAETQKTGGVGRDEVPDAQGIGWEHAWRITEQPAKRRFLSRSIRAHLPLTGTEQVYQVTQKDHQAEGSGGADATPSRNENKWWQAEPRLGRVAYGVADRVDRLKAIGNGQVPAAAVAAWIILWNRLHTEDWSSR